MNSAIVQAFRARRKALELTQREIAHRSGIKPYLVSRFESGQDLRLSTLLKLALALDLELLPIPREDAAKVLSLLQAKREPPSSPNPPSLLERYHVKDDEGASNG
jgi:transcriptional regulator with XRE-family HTH domain